MLIKRRHPFTNKINTMEIDVTDQQLRDWTAGGLIQNVMPNIRPDQREFLMTGFLQEDFNEMARAVEAEDELFDEDAEFVEGEAADVEEDGELPF